MFPTIPGFGGSGVGGLANSLLSNYTQARDSMLGIANSLGGAMSLDAFRGAMYGVAFLMLVWAFILRIKETQRNGEMNIINTVATLFAFVAVIGAIPSALGPTGTTGWLSDVFNSIGQTLSGGSSSNTALSDAMIANLQTAARALAQSSGGFLSLDALLSFGLMVILAIALGCLAMMDLVTVLLMCFQSFGLTIMVAMLPLAVGAMAFPGGQLANLGSVGWGWIMGTCQLLLWPVALGLVDGIFIQLAGAATTFATNMTGTAGNAFPGMIVCAVVAIFGGVATAAKITVVRMVGRLLPGGNSAAAGMIGNVASAPVHIGAGAAKTAASAAIVAGVGAATGGAGIAPAAGGAAASLASKAGRKL